MFKQFFTHRSRAFLAAVLTLVACLSLAASASAAPSSSSLPAAVAAGKLDQKVLTELQRGG